MDRKYAFNTIEDCPDVTFPIGSRIKISMSYFVGDFPQSRIRYAQIMKTQLHMKDFTKLAEQQVQTDWKGLVQIPPTLHDIKIEYLGCSVSPPPL